MYFEGKKMKYALCVLVISINACLQLASAAPTKEHLSSLSFKSGQFWSDCSKQGDHGKINSITITPNPPVRGSDVSIQANLTTDEEVSKGSSVIVDGSYNGFIPYHETYDLCDLVKDVHKHCPIPKGQLVFTLKMNLPSEAPQGTYSGKAKAKDQNGHELLCLSVDFTLN